LIKDPMLSDVDDDAPGAHPYVDRDGIHEIYQAWRRIADSYPGGRALIGEIWLPDPERFARYLRPDEMHTAFNFDFLRCPWDAEAFRRVIDATLAAHAPVGAPATWVLSNHDVTRHVTRYGRADTTFDFADRRHGVPLDLRLGTRRARAAALLAMALPGAVYLYQGEELGLWEIEDIPDSLRQDPMWTRSDHVDPGRDGCRVPMPWSGDLPPFGFSPPDRGAEPWLPQPAEWKAHTVEVESANPQSMLRLYRDALRLRRARLHDDAMRWLPGASGTLAFARGNEFACVVNFSGQDVALPPYAGILLASGPLDGPLLPPDTAAWLWAYGNGAELNPPDDPPRGH
jgi:alpha-glucosidase